MALVQCGRMGRNDWKNYRTWSVGLRLRRAMACQGQEPHYLRPARTRRILIEPGYMAMLHIGGDYTPETGAQHGFYIDGTASQTCRQPGKFHLLGKPAHCEGFTG